MTDPEARERLPPNLLAKRGALAATGIKETIAHTHFISVGNWGKKVTLHSAHGIRNNLKIDSKMTVRIMRPLN